LETSNVSKIKTPYRNFLPFPYGDKKQCLRNFSRQNHLHLHNINGFTEDEKLWFFHPVAFVQHLMRIFNQVVFPFEKVKNGEFDAADFLTHNARKYGTSRSSGTRAHAGVDLYATEGTDILALKEGKITDHREYLNPDNASVQNTVYALTVDHYDYVVRYCEIGNKFGDLPNGLKVGSIVKTGQVIASVGEIIWDSGNTQSMLHFELYDPGIAKGPWYANAANSKLCSFNNNIPFKRSKKLKNPTEFLKKLL